MTTKPPETHRRIEEFCTLVERQRRLIVILERNGNDVVSAEIVLESLLASLFLSIVDKYKVHRYIQPGRPMLAAQAPAACAADNRKFWQPKASAEKSQSALIILFPRVVAPHEGKIPMPTIDKSKRQLDKAPIVPDFRPLTEEEKKEYINSFSDESKKILAGLKGEKSLPQPTVPTLKLLSNTPPARTA